MSVQLPQRIDPLQLADRGARLVGTLALEDMVRLRTSLHDATGVVSVELDFERDGNAQRYLRGSLSTRLNVLCQRCLRPMQVDIKRRLGLALVNLAETLTDQAESLLVDSETISLSDMIEDELILALPIAPLHLPADCSANAARPDGDNRETVNPFAALASLRSARGTGGEV